MIDINKTEVYDPIAIGFQSYKMSGNEAIVLCPFHPDEHPSASFNIVNGMFHCFACGASASIHRLVAALEGSIQLIERKGIDTTEVSDWSHFFEHKLAIDHPYLIKRRVSNDAIELYNIMQCSQGIIFPLYDDKNDAHGFMIRRFDNSPRYMVFGEKTPVWPYYEFINLPTRENIFLVEGIFGALRGRAYGYTVFANMGIAAKKDIFYTLANMSVKVAFDSDDAGLIGAARILHNVPNARVLLPGFEVDELDKDDWDFISGPNALSTSFYSDIISAANNKKFVSSAITKIMKSKSLF